MNYSVSSWQMKRLAFLPRSVWYLTVSTVFTLYTWKCVHYKYRSWGNHRAPRDTNGLQPQPTNITITDTCEHTTEGRADILYSGAHVAAIEVALCPFQRRRFPLRHRLTLPVPKSGQEHYIVRSTSDYCGSTVTASSNSSTCSPVSSTNRTKRNANYSEMINTNGCKVTR